jgi:hypothetical protein
MVTAVGAAGTGATVGAGGPEFTLQAPAGEAIYAANGSFPSVAIASESDSLAGANAYSLQLNTNPFWLLWYEPFCTNDNNPGGPNSCTGWEQFVYQVHNGVADLKIEYWAMGNDAASCPAPWNYYPAYDAAGVFVENDCWMDAPAVSVPVVPPADLASVQLSGAVSPTGDTVTFTYGNNAPITATGPDTFKLGTNGDYANDVGAWSWTSAEFNIFGQGGGSNVTLNTFANLTVQITANEGPMSDDQAVDIPTCGGTSFTGEYSNLDLGTCTPFAGALGFRGFPHSIAYVRALPGITFTEDVPFLRIIK